MKARKSEIFPRNISDMKASYDIYLRLVVISLKVIYVE